MFSIPKKFGSYKEADDYHVKHGLSRLRSSAEISIPALFTELENESSVRRTDLKKKFFFKISGYLVYWFIISICCYTQMLVIDSSLE